MPPRARFLACRAGTREDVIAPPIRRLAAVAGAMGAQLSQAAGSLLISVLAVRVLDITGFAALSVLLAGVVFVTGLTTGLVGDTLTVLDRADPAIRTALRRLLLTLMAASLVLGPVTAAHLAGGPAAAAFGVLLALWIGEDVLRRLLMANLRFWSIVAVDLTHLAVSSGLVLAWPALTRSSPGVGVFLGALACGQVCAGAVAVALLPPRERRLGPAAPGGLPAVLAFGTSRSVQAALRPAVLLLMRIVVIAAAGVAAFGRLEAARIYAAPALLVVQGVGAYLLSAFAADRAAARPVAVRRADAASLVLTAATAAFTAVAVALAVWAPGLLSAAVPVSPLAVASWGAFTGAVALAQPYGSLAAVAGGQRRVLAVRALDSCVSLGALALAVGPIGIGPDLAPAALAVGPLVGALLLRPLARRRAVPSSGRAAAGTAPSGARP